VQKWQLTFGSATPFVLPLQPTAEGGGRNDAATATLSNDSFPRVAGAAKPSSRQNKWSELYIPFQQSERRCAAC